MSSTTPTHISGKNIWNIIHIWKKKGYENVLKLFLSFIQNVHDENLVSRQKVCSDGVYMNNNKKIPF